MDTIDVINHHMVIRDTIGYDELSKIEVWNIPQVMRFLKIVHNYERMKRLK